MMSAALQSIPGELYEAMDIDGGGFWPRLRHVVWPHVNATLGSTALTLSIMYLTLITLILVLTGGGPLGATSTWSFEVFITAFRSVDVSPSAVISIIVLLVNLLLALKLAWPARGQSWRRVLLPGFGGPAAATFYRWHRALGLCLFVPAIVIVSCGVLQQWPADRWLGVDAPAPAADATKAASTTTLGAALAVALQRYPGAALALVEMPGTEQPWYRIRLRQAGELRRVFGETTVYIDARDAAVLLDRDAFKLPLNEKIANAFYPVHTGEFLGFPGRLVSLLSGLSLIAMIGLGAGVWWTRRRARSPATASVQR